MSCSFVVLLYLLIVSIMLAALSMLRFDKLDSILRFVNIALFVIVRCFAYTIICKI